MELKTGIFRLDFATTNGKYQNFVDGNLINRIRVKLPIYSSQNTNIQDFEMNIRGNEMQPKKGNTLLNVPLYKFSNIFKTIELTLSPLEMTFIYKDTALFGEVFEYFKDIIKEIFNSFPVMVNRFGFRTINLFEGMRESLNFFSQYYSHHSDNLVASIQQSEYYFDEYRVKLNVSAENNFYPAKVIQLGDIKTQVDIDGVSLNVITSYRELHDIYHKISAFNDEVLSNLE